MKYKVIRKQENSKMCLICGLENNGGLKASFYEMENNDLVAIFKAAEGHQSYPGILHGGMISAILDETIGRAYLIKNTDVWGVTINLNIQYYKPVPLYEKIKVIGRIHDEDEKFFEGKGEILLQNGDIATRGFGKYMKLPFDKITNFDINATGWGLIPFEDDPLEIDY